MSNNRSLNSFFYSNLGPDLWRGVASALQATRVGRKRQLVDDPYRTPLIELKYGKDGWVQHEHKGITYVITYNLLCIDPTTLKNC